MTSAASDVYKGPYQMLQEAYVTFGASQRVTAKELKKLHKELVMIYRPDKGGDVALCAECTNAFQIITEFMQMPERLGKMQEGMAEVRKLSGQATGQQGARLEGATEIICGGIG